MNSTQFFEGILIVADIKKLYHKLCMIHHPDKGGSTARMQELNSQYASALKRADGQVNTDEEGKEHTYKYDDSIEQALIIWLDRLICSGVLNDGCEAFIIGTWIWIIGETFKHAKTLGKAGLDAKYHGQKKCWYYTPSVRKHFHSGKDLSYLAGQYGASKVAEGKRDEKRSELK